MKLVSKQIQLDLDGIWNGSLNVEVRPEPVVKPEPSSRTIERIQDLMDHVHSDPTPEGWQRKEISNGSSYFTSAAGKETIVCTPSPKSTQKLVGSDAHIEPDLGLPSGWDQRTTEAGKIYYMDHRNRLTQWVPPSDKGLS
ncbi:uncharacterized protein BDZ99DRAFT_114431 [Mytilinidion resinicola]|uniref:WW domain-containing protein n=1 Tax=Mytilinidion resinicola TaxID=574789 RepID=A0A6A6Y8L4_9PEZI|nr:uncharacterized protein BDZ99DRAFT_114431 [Mytilinidion resinicola]KAF2805162.1 hypothetical protein BDZ99DRAFT_114431 [Mytilinidion resinicola]